MDKKIEEALKRKQAGLEAKNKAHEKARVGVKSQQNNLKQFESTKVKELQGLIQDKDTRQPLLGLRRPNADIRDKFLED